MRDINKQNEYDEIYITSNKSLHKIGPDRWIYNWKGLVYYEIDGENMKRICEGRDFIYIKRTDEKF